jgi:hypothetical protein
MVLSLPRLIYPPPGLQFHVTIPGHTLHGKTLGDSAFLSIDLNKR